MSAPPSRILPASGVPKPASIRSSVVLPQPDGPSRAKNSPARISSDSLSTATKPPKRFVTPSMRSSGMSATGAARGGSCKACWSVMVPARGPHANGGSDSAQPAQGCDHNIMKVAVAVWAAMLTSEIGQRRLAQTGWNNHDKRVQAGGTALLVFDGRHGRCDGAEPDHGRAAGSFQHETG